MLTGRAQEPFIVVSANDEAIDRESAEGIEALEKYLEERDPAVLVYQPGAQPTRFVCRPLSHHARLFVESQPSAAMRHEVAFRACVTAVENFRLPNGDPWHPGKAISAAWEKGATILDDAPVKQLGDAGLGIVVEEVGAVCLARANMTPAQKKVYPRPRGLVVGFGRSSDAPSPTTTAPHLAGST